MPSSFISKLRNNGNVVILISLSLILASSALGVQRTALAAYTQVITSVFDSYILIGAAISLAFFGFSKAIGNVFGGRLADSIGRSRVIQIGVATLTIGSFGLYYSTNLVIFALVNLAVGLGIGLLFASAAVSLTDIGGPRHRAKSISLMELSVYVGTSIGSIVAGSIAAEQDFRAAFLYAGILVLFVNFVGLGISETSQMVKGEVSGKYSSALTRIEKIQPELNLKEDKTNFSIPKDLSIHDKSEVTDNNNRKSYTEYFAISTGFASRLSDSAMILMFPLFILLFNYSPIRLGILTSLFTICWSIGIFFTGIISDNFGRKYPIIIGLIMESVGLSIIFLFNANALFTLMFIGTLIAGFGRGIYFPIPASIISDIADPQTRGKRLGIYRFGLDFGYVIGSILLVIIVDLLDLSSDKLRVMKFAGTIIIGILIIQAFLLFVFFKDPRPGFRHFEVFKCHITYINKAIEALSSSLQSFSQNQLAEAQIQLDEGKKYEQLADEELVKITHETYYGTWHSPDATELLLFSTKIDKSLGYVLRAIRKLLMVKDNLSSKFLSDIRRYGLLLKTLMMTSCETAMLIDYRMSLAVQQSYEANIIESILDEIYAGLWADLTQNADKLKPINLLLLSQAIDSLEKSSNTIEDAAELIRLISFKH